MGNSRGFVLSLLGSLKVFPLRVQMRRPYAWLPTGQWLVVFFDVPEQQRRIRDRLRAGLRHLGFSPLQRSVWATRRNVGKEVAELIALLGARSYVKPLLVHEYRQNQQKNSS